MVSRPPETMIPARAHEPLVVAASFCGLAGLYGWAYFATSFARDGLIGPHVNAPGVDFMVFWEAPRAALRGDLALLADGVRFTATLNQQFAWWLSAPLPFHPWIYPPHFLLLLLPLGLLPFQAAYAIFIVVSFAVAVLALVAGEGRPRRVILASALLLSPAAAITALAGQNALLAVAILVGGFRLRRARPALGGALLGVLSLKPQLFLMVPVTLVAARDWRALAGCITAALALVAASIAAFGIGPWQAWIGAMLDPANEIHRGWSALSLLWGDSVYTDATLLGAGPMGAALAQGAAILAAAVAIMRAPKNLAVFLAASVLAAPHVAPYDMVLLSVAGGLFFADATERGLRPFDLPLALATWVAALYGVPIVSPLGYCAPLVVLLFLARTPIQPP
jgi:alpha-1,2-mannosyltransferase